MTLSSLLADAAIDLPATETTLAPDGAVTWARGGRAFATLAIGGTVVEFGLDPSVAAAAVRTPDVSPSGRGPGWVAFAPAELDDHAADRAVAWFASAHRRLGPRD
jgi:hypothetical protein